MDTLEQSNDRKVRQAVKFFHLPCIGNRQRWRTIEGSRRTQLQCPMYHLSRHRSQPYYPVCRGWRSRRPVADTARPSPSPARRSGDRCGSLRLASPAPTNFSISSTILPAPTRLSSLMPGAPSPARQALEDLRSAFAGLRCWAGSFVVSGHFDDTIDSGNRGVAEGAQRYANSARDIADGSATDRACQDRGLSASVMAKGYEYSRISRTFSYRLSNAFRRAAEGWWHHCIVSCAGVSIVPPPKYMGAFPN
jgi:hypothetical protein